MILTGKYPIQRRTEAAATVCVAYQLSCRSSNPLRKNKVKCTPVQALRLCTGRTAHTGSRGIALLFLDHSTGRTAHRGSRGRALLFLEHSTGRTAHRGSRGIAVIFLDHSTRGGEGSVSRPGRSLSPGKARYPLYRRLGGFEGRSE